MHGTQSNAATDVKTGHYDSGVENHDTKDTDGGRTVNTHWNSTCPIQGGQGASWRKGNLRWGLKGKLALASCRGNPGEERNSERWWQSGAFRCQRHRGLRTNTRAARPASGPPTWAPCSASPRQPLDSTSHRPPLCSPSIFRIS